MIIIVCFVSIIIITILCRVTELCICVYTGPLYNLQTQFTNRQLPTGCVTQHGFVSYPSVPVLHQQGIVPQPLAFSHQQYDPQALHFTNRVVSANNVYHYGHASLLNPMHPRQSTPTQYPHIDGINCYGTANALVGNRRAYYLETALQATNRNQQSESVVSHSLLNRLADEHHSTLLKQLTNYAAAWKVIGTHLGFHPGELSNIEARPNLIQGAPVSWLSAMLSQWLQWAPGDSRRSTSFATLQDLKTALDHAGLAATAHDLGSS